MDLWGGLDLLIKWVLRIIRFALFAAVVVAVAAGVRLGLDLWSAGITIITDWSGAGYLSPLGFMTGYLFGGFDDRLSIGTIAAIAASLLTMMGSLLALRIYNKLVSE